MADFHVVWCPHPHCNAFAFSRSTPEEDAKALRRHLTECDGLRYEREIGAREANMRSEGCWDRLLRRWASKHQ